MNFGVIFRKAADVARSVGGSTVIVAKKHAPELLMGSGVVCFALTIIQTVKATNQTHDILDEREKSLECCTKQLAHDVERDKTNYTREEYEDDLRKIKKKARVGLAKAWIPVGTEGALTVILFLSAYKIINGRYVGATMAYKVLESQFDRYRGNVVERFGQDVDREMLYTIKAEELEKAEQEREEHRKLEESGKKQKIIRKRKMTAYQDIWQDWFDSYSDRWQRYWNSEQVMQYLKHKQNEFNDRLQIQKFLFVNDVRTGLGLEPSSEGQLVGWIITKGNPNSHVSLGIDEMPESELREILGTRRNEEIRVRLRLNPDGIMYNMIDKKDYTGED